MFTKFWDKLSEELAGQWTAQALGPALAFWGGGLLTWVSRHGWQPLLNWLAGFDTAVYVALAVGGLLLLAASSVAVTWLQLTVLRLLEGYWPWPFELVRFALARRLEKRLQKREDEWQALHVTSPQARTAVQRARYARLDAELARYPVESYNLMPTRLGNLLRAAEEYPQMRYGLAMSVCWPRLWLLLPKEAQETITSIRERLDGAARSFMWGVLLAAWIVWAQWIVLVSLAVAIVAYLRMLRTASDYGDLLRAAFDLHRFALYEALRWPLPDGPAGEEVHGQRLSEYLFRGTATGAVQFTTTKKEQI